MKETTLSRCIEKLKEKDTHPAVISLFTRFYIDYLEGSHTKIEWQNLTPLKDTDLLQLPDIQEFEAAGKAALSQTAVLKLNGGLGTSMGCKEPKSFIEIEKGRTFLDFTLDQIQHYRLQYDIKLPLLLMNSYSTYRETEQKIASIPNVFGLMQHQFPRIGAKTKLPFISYEDSELEWHPPGHGDVYYALDRSGFLDDLIASGYRYLFMSNSDNLGATVSLPILGYLAKNRYDFVVETTPKTELDIKGGTFVYYQDKMTLLERAQVPENHIQEFENTFTFPIFNTNSIWLDLHKLKEVLTKKALHLQLIVNPKQIEGQDVVQLESAMGSAISSFEHSRVIVVDRSRFLPVKTTSDLLLLKSDLFIKHEDGRVERNPERKEKTLPKITLEDPFDTVSAFERRFKQIPSLMECHSLRLAGNIYFGDNVKLQGDIVLNHKEKFPLIFENQTL